MTMREPPLEAAVASNGQATPKVICEHLGLKPGDRIKFFIHPDGSVVMLPKLATAALRGFVKHQDRAIGLDEMDEAIAEGTTEKSR